MIRMCVCDEDNIPEVSLVEPLQYLLELVRGVEGLQSVGAHHVLNLRLKPLGSSRALSIPTPRL